MITIKELEQKRLEARLAQDKFLLAEYSTIIGEYNNEQSKKKPKSLQAIIVSFLKSANEAHDMEAASLYKSLLPKPMTEDEMIAVLNPMLEFGMNIGQIMKSLNSYKGVDRKFASQYINNYVR